MARSLTDLQSLCGEHGMTFPADASREDLMDLLRAKFGTFDPAVQIDPMKAGDLKHKIAWGEKDHAVKFAGIADFLTEDWVADAKLDGARMRMFLGTTANTMNTGRRSDTTYAYIERADNFPHLRDMVAPDLAGTILDGEMMPPKDSILTDSGIQTKGTLNSIMSLVNCRPEIAVRTQAREGRAVFVAFDVLSVMGEDVQHLPFSERRALLEKVLDRLDQVHPEDPRTLVAVPQMAATTENIQLCLDMGMEGVILKKRDGKYEPGKRSKVWQKVKRMSTGDFVIFGSVPGKGRNEGKVGSMKVGYWTGASTDVVVGDDGTKYSGLIYCADVAGITDAYRENLTGPDGHLDPKHFLRVIEVQAQGRSKNDRLRHPLWVRDREDKMADECEAACSIDLFEEV